jgi:hypothetical protein
MSTGISRFVSVIVKVARILCILRVSQLIMDPVPVERFAFRHCDVESPTADRDILADLLRHSINRETIPGISDDDYALLLNASASIAMLRATSSSVPNAQDLIARLLISVNPNDALIDLWIANITKSADIISQTPHEFVNAHRVITQIIYWFAATEKYSAMQHDDAVDFIVAEYMPPIQRHDVSKQSRELFMKSLGQFAKSTHSDSLFQHILNAHHMIEIMHANSRTCSLIIQKIQDKIAHDFYINRE